MEGQCDAEKRQSGDLGDETQGHEAFEEDEDPGRSCSQIQRYIVDGEELIECLPVSPGGLSPFDHPCHEVGEGRLNRYVDKSNRS